MNVDWVHTLPFDKLVQMDTKPLCFLPYHNHPKGCPNAYGKCWSKRKSIVFDSVPLSSQINDNYPIYIVHSEFNVENHASKMQTKHPSWTERQCRNLLYWQNTSRAMLNHRITKVKKLINDEYIVETCPEYYGANVYKTCANVNLILDPIKTLKICRHIAFLFMPKYKNL